MLIKLKNGLLDGQKYEMGDIYPTPDTIYVSDQVINGIFLKHEKLPYCYEYTLTDESTYTYSFSKKIVNPPRKVTLEENINASKMLLKASHIMVLDTLHKIFHLAGVANDVCRDIRIMSDGLANDDRKDINKIFDLSPALVVSLFNGLFHNLKNNIEKVGNVIFVEKKLDTADDSINLIKEKNEGSKE